MNEKEIWRYTIIGAILAILLVLLCYFVPGLLPDWFPVDPTS